MTFISWLVFGILFMLSEFATGTLYLLAAGLAFIYPAIAAYTGQTSEMQMAVLGAGALIHMLIVMIWRKLSPSVSAKNSAAASVIGQRVEVVEWLDESSARVSFRGQLWEADKDRSEMPDAAYGIIKSVNGSRLVITTEPA